MRSNNSKTAGAFENDLADVLASIQDKAAMRRFVREIFTPAEISDFSLRWRLMRMLKAGIPQREIASTLRISLCKITRGARILRNPDAVSHRYLQPSAPRRPHA